MSDETPRADAPEPPETRWVPPGPYGPVDPAVVAAQPQAQQAYAPPRPPAPTGPPRPFPGPRNYAAAATVVVGALICLGAAFSPTWASDSPPSLQDDRMIEDVVGGPGILACVIFLLYAAVRYLRIGRAGPAVALPTSLLCLVVWVFLTDGSVREVYPPENDGYAYSPDPGAGLWLLGLGSAVLLGGAIAMLMFQRPKTPEELQAAMTPTAPMLPPRPLPSSVNDELLALEQQHLRGHISAEELERARAAVLRRYQR